jgi:hypothetical protein
VFPFFAWKVAVSLLRSVDIDYASDPTSSPVTLDAFSPEVKRSQRWLTTLLHLALRSRLLQLYFRPWLLVRKPTMPMELPPWSAKLVSTVADVRCSAIIATIPVAVNLGFLGHSPYF